MGAFLCRSVTKEDTHGWTSQSKRRVRSKADLRISHPSAAQVLANFDLLQQVLLKLAPGKGCSVATRAQLSQVCRLWREVARTLPISLEIPKQLTDEQVKCLKAGSISCIRHISFSGSEETSAHEILSSAAFQRTSGPSLCSITGLPFQDDMSHLQQFAELSSLALCRRNWVTLMELVKGTKHSMEDLEGMQKLKSLTLKDLAGPQAALDLCHLPTSLEDLHLVNTSFVHHPEMKLPEGLHLRSLTASSLGKRSTIIPVELLRRTQQAILRGKEVYLTGRPVDHPDMEEDSMEIVMNNGMLFLFAFGMPQVQHETRTAAIMQKLENSDLQILRLCTELGGGTHLVDRSDCRKGLRWKSLEIAAESSFMADVSAAGEAPSSGFGCRVEERHSDGSIHSMCLSRAGTPKQEAEAALAHLTLLQAFLVDQLHELEEHVRHLGTILEARVE